MSPPRFLRLLLLLLLLALVPLSLCVPRGTLINCGSAVKTVIEGREWLPDGDFVSGGTPRNLTGPVLFPTLSTVRSFPNNRNRKSCYTVNVYRDAKYMVRTTYFYHGGDTESPPPVFDQIVDGTLWAVVNTTEDYARGDASYYEGVFLAKGKTMSVCLGSNSYTESDPFISALEFVILEDSLYNSTDFSNFGLGLVARHGFGYTGHIIRYPDDKFDRFWEPFGGPNPVIVRNTNASVSGLWNQPPLKVFKTELTSGQAETMELDWPPGSVPESRYYYIALYFALGMEGSRVLNISINGVPYYKDLDVTPEGLVVFASRWPLSGATRITLTPSPGSSGGPLINAGEVFAVLPLGGTTLTRDVIALQRVKQSLHNPPSDWNGDPCMPSQYSWTGITCSSGPRIRVVTLNLTSMGLSGSLSPSIANMTGLSAIYLGNNNLSGPIPDLSALKRLENLHLEDNNFSGDLPPSLGNIDSLHELFLQNNNLTGQIPTSLIGRSGLDLRTSGNSFSSAPPSS